MRDLQISHWPITRKLTAVIMLTSVITLGLAVSGFLAYEFVNYRQGIKNELQTMADIMDENMASTLRFTRPDVAQANLETLRTRQDIICAAVYDSKGAIFARYVSPHHQFIPPSVNGPRWWSLMFYDVELVHPIVSDHEKVGALYLKVGSSDILKRITEYALIVGTLALGALAVAFLVSTQLQKIISDPILRVAEVARQVSLRKDYSLRVNLGHKDELGSLIDAFNEMLGEIFNRDCELQAANLKLASHSIGLEQEVQSRTAALQAKTKEAEHQQMLAERANRAKSEFLTQMSHELRTPLNGILGYAQILKNERSLSSAQRDGVSIIERSGEHLLNLINDILDLSKIESRKLELVLENFSLRHLIGDIGVMTRIRAEVNHLVFTIKGLDNLPLAVHGDSKRLRQVLLNLLGNAVKFTEKGEVVLRTTRYGDNVRFEISDTGVGISAEKMEEIFLPFHQVGDNRRFIEGTGLGLAISHHLVRLMGGQLEAKSALGAGSVFYFEIPLPEVQPLNMSEPRARKRLVGYEGGRQEILVVDDLQENRQVLKEMLHPLGFVVLEAGGGVECLEMINRRVPDLIIMDLMMSGLDGYETTRKIRQMNLDLPVIASSASVFLENQKKSFQAGCHDFLSKPVRYEDLIGILTIYLQLEWYYEVDESKFFLDEHVIPVGGVPPDSECQVILSLVQRGDVKRIYEHIDRLENDDPLFVPFTRHIRKLLGQFEINMIDAYIEKLMKER